MPWLARNGPTFGYSCLKGLRVELPVGVMVEGMGFNSKRLGSRPLGLGMFRVWGLGHRV